MANHTGDIASTQISDLIHLVCSNQKSCTILVTDHLQKGIIVVHQGKVIHARWSSLKGEAAFAAMIPLTSGRFELEESASTLQQTISKDWQTLLLNCAVESDENIHLRLNHLAPLRDHIQPLPGLFVAVESAPDQPIVEHVGSYDPTCVVDMVRFFDPITSYLGSLLNLGRPKALLCGSKQSLYMQRSVHSAVIGSYFDPRIGSRRHFLNFARATSTINRLRKI